MIGAGPLAPVLAAAAQNRRPMSLPGLGTETGTIAVAPIMVNHDVVAHLVTVRPAAADAGRARSWTTISTCCSPSTRRPSAGSSWAANGRSRRPAAGPAPS